jgi:hypothetical protein
MSNIVNVLDKNAVEVLVSDFDKKFKAPAEKAIMSINGQIDGLQIKSRDHTYEMVAGLVDLAITLDVENPTAGYESFLVERAIAKPNKNVNPYMAFIKAVFSELKNNTWVFGTAKRSYEKHANHVRFLVNAKRNGTLTGTVPDFIRAYPEMLKGIEAQDRADNPNAAQKKRVADVRNKGRTVAPRATISHTFSGSDGDVMKLYGRVVNGQLEVLGGKVVSNDNEKESIYFYLGSQTV